MFITILILAVSVSMDAFSMAFIYGTITIEKKLELKLSIIVGLFHFVMPIIGLYVGEFFYKLIHLKMQLFLTMILIMLGLEMIFSNKDSGNNLVITNIRGMFLFSLAVSMDSLTLGTGLGVITNNYFLVGFSFFSMSLILTMLGFKVGKKVNQKIGDYSCFLGGVLLIIMSLILNLI